MKYVVLILTLWLGWGSAVEAQQWHQPPNTRPWALYDQNKLPLSVTFNWYAPEGWTPVNGTTWEAIWPREASGAWYRPLAYSQSSIYKGKVFPYAYSCRTQGNNFVCRDLVRGIDRNVACPTSITSTPMVLWRSRYSGAFPEDGLWTANIGPFVCMENLRLPLQAAYVTDAGKRINCQYGNPTAQGPGLTMDRWCWRVR